MLLGIKESINVLMIKFDILGKSKCPVSQIGTSSFYSGMFLGSAHVTRTIWLNFTQEINKCFKLQEDELKVNI
jgi:hypothetical protein